MGAGVFGGGEREVRFEEAGAFGEGVAVAEDCGAGFAVGLVDCGVVFEGAVLGRLYQFWVKISV
jgi:hypothetical protein